MKILPLLFLLSATISFTQNVINPSGKGTPNKILTTQGDYDYVIRHTNSFSKKLLSKSKNFQSEKIVTIQDNSRSIHCHNIAYYLDTIYVINSIDDFGKSKVILTKYDLNLEILEEKVLANFDSDFGVSGNVRTFTAQNKSNLSSLTLDESSFRNKIVIHAFSWIENQFKYEKFTLDKFNLAVTHFCKNENLSMYILLQPDILDQLKNEHFKYKILRYNHLGGFDLNEFVNKNKENRNYAIYADNKSLYVLNSNYEGNNGFFSGYTLNTFSEEFNSLNSSKRTYSIKGSDLQLKTNWKDSEKAYNSHINPSSVIETKRRVKNIVTPIEFNILNKTMKVLACESRDVTNLDVNGNFGPTMRVYENPNISSIQLDNSNITYWKRLSSSRISEPYPFRTLCINNNFNYYTSFNIADNNLIYVQNSTFFKKGNRSTKLNIFKKGLLIKKYYPASISRIEIDNTKNGFKVYPVVKFPKASWSNSIYGYKLIHENTENLIFGYRGNLQNKLFTIKK